jgi:hypothetical protein
MPARSLLQLYCHLSPTIADAISTELSSVSRHPHGLDTGGTSTRDAHLRMEAYATLQAGERGGVGGLVLAATIGQRLWHRDPT